MPGCHQRNPVLKLAPSFRSKFVAWKVAEDLWKSKSHVIHPFIHLSSVYVQMPYYVCIYIYMCVCVHPSIHPSIHPPTHPPIHPPESLKPHHPSAKPWIIGRFLQGFPSLAASPRRRAAAREDPSLHRWRSVQRIRDQGSGQKVEDIMVLEMLDPQVTHRCGSILQWSNDLGDLGVLPF